MLELAGLVVDLVPGQVEIVGEKALAQAVSPHQPKGLAAALAREQHPAGRVAFDEPFAGQPRDHLRNGRSRQTELVGHAAHSRAVGVLGHLEDRFEVLLATLAALAHVWLPSLPA